MSKDPIGISGGLNLYAFVSNNPVNFVDPSGFFEEELDWAINEIRESGYNQIANDLTDMRDNGSIHFDVIPGSRGEVEYFSSKMTLNPDCAAQDDAFLHTVLEEYVHTKMNQNIATQTFTATLDIWGRIASGVEYVLGGNMRAAHLKYVPSEKIANKLANHVLSERSKKGGGL